MFVISIFIIASFSISSSSEELHITSSNIDDASFYTAGVVEFPLLASSSLSDVLAEYLEIIHSKEAERTDIIVFPEGALNKLKDPTLVPDGDAKIAPCEADAGEFEEFFIRISCAAKITGKYIVINVLEKYPCTLEEQQKIGDKRPCSSNGWSTYNTNAVFDRNGTVISRYRKWNLFGETSRNSTFQTEYKIFETDFGVKFGHFICFDIIFYQPAGKLVQEFGVKNFIFPTQWFSELPFLTAVQYQQSWSYANNVNVLASGANYPEVGTTGTGIYAGRQGALISVMNSNMSAARIYVAKVPKDPNTKIIMKKTVKIEQAKNNLKLLQFRLFENQTILLDVRQMKFERTIKTDDLVCDFSLNILKNSIEFMKNRYKYRAYAFNGFRSYSGTAEGSIKICSLVACFDESVESCGKLVQTENEIVFNDISIHAEFENTYGRSLVMPNTLKSSVMPLTVEDFRFETHQINGENSHPKGYVTMELLRPISNLLAFGIYVHPYTNE